MKIRNDFVSNSSSSSFVMFGYVFDDKRENRVQWAEKLYDLDTINKYCGREKWEDMSDDDKEDIVYDVLSNEDWKVAFGSEDGISKGKVAVGIRYDVADDGFDREVLTFDEVVAKLEPLKQKLGVEKAPVIIMGVRSC